MKTGWKPRWKLVCVIFLFMYIIPSHAQWDTWLYVTVLNTGQTIKDGPLFLDMKLNEIIGLEFIGYFRNSSTDKQYFGVLGEVNNSDIPDYFEDWENKSVVLKPDERATLRTTLYLRPTVAGKDTFLVWTTIRKGPSKTDPSDVSVFEIQLNVTDLDTTQFDLPQLVFDSTRFSRSKHASSYSRGLSNTISWIPGNGSNILAQDIFYFHADEYGNLKQSVQQVFKTSQGGPSRSALFQDLENGEQYGYIGRAIFQADGDTTLTLYSDVMYSIQDNEPPKKVITPYAKPIFIGGKVQVSWEPVQDELSGIASYRIYRSADTGPEIFVADSSYYPLLQDTLYWYDTIDSSITYHYRIRAIDRVGNEGDGDRSNGVYLDGSEIIPPPIDDLDDNSDSIASYTDTSYSPYIKGTIDTLRVRLDVWEEKVRFQAVRDSIAYFDNPPPVPMHFFDSGWVPRCDSWIFDYRYNNSADVYIDPNFVNNHTYHRRVIRASNTDTLITVLGDTIPDCFPPDDIYNLTSEAIITDPEFSDPTTGYSDWSMRIKWNPASDGVSGLKNYHIFRKIEGLDDNFITIAATEDTYFTDHYIPEEGAIRNPIIRYRVVAEDMVSNLRIIDDTEWETQDRALCAPEIAGDDTMFTLADTLMLRFKNFDYSDVKQFVVSLNGIEMNYNCEGADSLVIPLKIDVFSRIKIRVLYQGLRSSVWSQTKIVSKYNLPPSNLMAWNDPDDWEGHLYLQWNRSSVDNKKYEVWRRCEGEDWRAVDLSIFSSDDTIRWRDGYNIDELSGAPTEALVAYKSYIYRVRMITTNEDTSDYSIESSAYCNRPPLIVDDILIPEWNGKPAIKIFWNRAAPSLATDTDSWITRVWISRDSLSNLIDSTYIETDVVDSTVFYWNENVQNGHNYIFRIRETVQDLGGRFSGKSMPYTVQYAWIDSLYVLPQPLGSIFISWEEDTLIDRLPVDSYQLNRIGNGNTRSWTFLNTTTFFMDNTDLVHGREYEYQLSALNDLGQVVAFNSKKAVCDTGPVFIPDDILQYQYFNEETITVLWIWNDISGKNIESPNDTTTRGADSLRIQVSASNTFPGDPVITEDTGWFKADPKNRNRVVFVPPAVKEDYNNNTILFSRIAAKDRWGHPFSTLWSPYFYPIESAAYDSIKPQTVTDLNVDSCLAYFGASDSVIFHLSWNDNSVLSEENLLANVNGYWMLMEYQRNVDTLGWVDAIPQMTAYHFSDTVQNRHAFWRVISVDSAGNTTKSDSVQAMHFIPTPPAPTPVDFLACTAVPNDSIYVQYFFEIALDPEHFRWAYELGSLGDSLISQSDWQNTNFYQDASGWGAFEVDTTWFRVKARKLPKWESGWSSLAYYTEGGSGASMTDVKDMKEDIPTVFKVEQNYPNPFNAQTIIAFQLPKPGHMEITVFNLRGSQVRTLLKQTRQAGHYTVIWDGKDDFGRSTASGIYMITVFAEMSDGMIFHDHIKVIQIK